MKIEQFSFECEKVIGFALLATRLAYWKKKKNSRQLLIQSEVKPRDALTLLFPRFSLPRCVYPSPDWFTGLPMLHVTGQGAYYVFGFTTLSWKLLSRNKTNQNKKCQQ